MRPAAGPVTGSTVLISADPALDPDTASVPVTAPPAAEPEPEATKGKSSGSRSRKVRVRKVRRIVRHIDPWSVLKISLLFYAALFLIICVASAVLWGAARAAGTIDNVESFITSVGGFGNCEPIDGAPRATTQPTTPDVVSTAPVDQLDPGALPEEVPDPDTPSSTTPGDEEDCREGEELVGEFQFEDGRILQAFALGGVVLVLAGAAANVVMVLLFNLMSDLTGGVRLTVLEEEPTPRPRPPSGSPPSRARG